MSRPAIFLDRDGTLVEARHYPSRPADLVLYEGIADPLRRMREEGYRLVVVSNQSGLARGLFSEHDLALMHSDLVRRLGDLGVTIDDIRYCPHHPEGVLPHLALRCACRKPMPGMLLQSAADLDIDLDRSWMVGDILDDIEAGHRAGCRTVLVDLGSERLPETRPRTPDYVARTTAEALAIIAAVEAHEHDADLAYRPASWLLPAAPMESWVVVEEAGGW